MTSALEKRKADEVREFSKGGCVKCGQGGGTKKSENFADVIKWKAPNPNCIN